MERRRQQKQDKGAPKWMVTFSDLMTLILVFFILLFSMSVVDASKFRAVAESFQQRAMFEFYPSLIPFDHPAEDIEIKRDPFDDVIDPFKDVLKEELTNQELNNLYEEVKQFLIDNQLNEVISASRDDRGVVLVLQERTLFETGEAQILDGAKPFLTKVATLLESIPNLVKVEGHTDSRPINTFRYPSNWELSGARASSVIRFLIENNDIDPYRFLAVGYGDTRPVVPNTTKENLQKNRRVVIVISDPNYNENELY
ncbi:flagellar motor protein MotS [Anaerobacillus alkalidiazotrophicus]|uniref:Flagellar motor protein MotS n=1 Tax=Anaerobacillus alkalidiazotrophicus TaxID=472963 RepID=A0A1S2M4N6_9BACI|nr:flagellar motor protein MotS [Anaerobacillus alkalidiazotrophicus]OIJ18229.1 flagellar motor protein MotS [Anaerobacillus alkalidiazotrophicus]OIJ19708.1 flagellar motor protein MotS [Anaerobacillus alkalidiazotrophicus]